MEFLYDCINLAKLELIRDAKIYVFFLLLEIFICAHKYQTIKGKYFNIKYAVLYHFTVALLVSPLCAFFVGLIKNAGFNGGIKVDLTSSTFLVYLGPAIYFFIVDFFYYWQHRAQHYFSFLWMQHKLHHSDEELNITTSERHHWTEGFLRLPIITIPMALLFEFHLMWVGVLSFIFSYLVFFNHANVRIGFGWFSRLLSSPQTHRIHHSNLPQHKDVNFAAYFPVWDIIFGTYYHPYKDEYPTTGLDSGEKIDTLNKAFFYPFTGILIRFNNIRARIK